MLAILYVRVKAYFILMRGSLNMKLEAVMVLFFIFLFYSLFFPFRHYIQSVAELPRPSGNKIYHIILSLRSANISSWKPEDKELYFSFFFLFGLKFKLVSLIIRPVAVATFSRMIPFTEEMKNTMKIIVLFSVMWISVQLLLFFLYLSPLSNSHLIELYIRRNRLRIDETVAFLFFLQLHLV